MVLNNRGQAVFYTFMIALVVIILAIAFAPTLKQFTDSARNSSSDTQVGLDCNNESISNFDKANCVVVDLGLPYFILGLIGIAGVIFGAKLLLQEA